jgi:hypothetical protein
MNLVLRKARRAKMDTMQRLNRFQDPIAVEINRNDEFAPLRAGDTELGR